MIKTRRGIKKVNKLVELNKSRERERNKLTLNYKVERNVKLVLQDLELSLEARSHIFH